MVKIKLVILFSFFLFLLFLGAFFFGKVYSASTPTVLSNAQLHLDIRPTCQVGQNCTLTGTFDQQANPTYSSFIGLQVYLIRVRQSSSAPNPGDFMPITVTGNQLPGGNPNQNVDFTSISGPLYDRMVFSISFLIFSFSIFRKRLFMLKLIMQTI